MQVQGVEQMKSVGDVAAVSTGGLVLFGMSVPDIAAGLAALYTAARLVEWLVTWAWPRLQKVINGKRLSESNQDSPGT